MDKPVQTAPPILLRTMGPVRLSDGLDRDLTPRGRKARALLAILAIEPGAVPRDRLADLLWSDRGIEQARASLRQAVFELRHIDQGDAGLVVSERDGLGFGRLAGWTDLDAIRHAAANGNGRRVAAQLEAAGEGLLSDLDGLDPELDGWLRQIRAIEPARTLSAALGAADAAMAEGDLATAAAIATQVQRLDPASEEAARIGIRIAHRQGDNAMVNRLYRQLRDTLHTAFDAEPSRETEALMTAIARGTESPPIALAPDHENAVIDPPGKGAETVRPARRNSKLGWGLAGLGLAGAAGLAWIAWPIATGAGAEAAPLVAVLPFDQYPAGDGALAEGIWDDTRRTLSRAQAVRVLGRTTSEALAARQWSPADYRKKLDVDYLLDGGVRRQGDRVRVTVSLVRTSDGVAIWEHAFDGRLGDAMALQGAIAQGIEGRVRGRLASGGGSRAEHIPTTPEVYELYLRSKQLLKNRTAQDATQAQALLEQAIRRDPNFAPALAMSASALYFSGLPASSQPDWRTEARRRAARAIDLAPRLAEGYAVSALIDGLNVRGSERKLEKATALDPGNPEAWLWLGNARNGRGDSKGAREAYEKAVAIDPYLTPALDNLADELLRSGDKAGFDRLVRKMQRVGGDATLVPALQAQAYFHAGDQSQGLKLLLPLIRNGKDSAQIRSVAASGLTMLGHVEKAAQLIDIPPQRAAILAGRELPDERLFDRELLLNPFSGNAVMRTAIRRGKSEAIVRLYRRDFSSVDQFSELLDAYGEIDINAPNLAVALQLSGSDHEAAALLEAAAKRASIVMGGASGLREGLAHMARIRAVQGRRTEAIAMLRRAVALGWRPDGVMIPVDLALDPPVARLDGPPFQAVRRTILNDVQRERRELGPLPD